MISSMEEKIHIVACFDKDFVMPTGVMMCSVCVNNPDVDIDFHLIYDESLSENDRKDLEDVVSKYQGKSTKFYPIMSQFNIKVPLNHIYIPQSTYYRLFLSEILPTSLHKVLYLDGDCIVRHSLLPLWNIDISEYAIGAIDDAECKPDFYNHLRYPLHKGYFNAGILLVNLDYWRSHGIYEQFMDYLKTNSDRIKFEDQDVMNVILQDQKQLLPAKYNLQTGFFKVEMHWDSKEHGEEVKEAIDDPVIVHFTTIHKPWIIDTSYPNPFRSTFLKYQNLTRWKGCIYDKRPFMKIIRNMIGYILRKLKLRNPLERIYIEVSPID